MSATSKRGIRGGGVRVQKISKQKKKQSGPGKKKKKKKKKVKEAASPLSLSPFPAFSFSLSLSLLYEFPPPPFLFISNFLSPISLIKRRGKGGGGKLTRRVAKASKQASKQNNRSADPYPIHFGILLYI